MRPLWPFAPLLLVASCRQQPPPSPAAQADAQAAQASCYLAPCHGAEVRCERGEAPMCTTSLERGDACRRFASCVDEGGACRLTKAPAFEACQACAARCADVDCELSCASKAGP